MSSTDDSSEEDNSDDEYISLDTFEDIRGGKHVHPNIDARDARYRIRDHIRKSQSEWTVAELSEKIMGKGLHKVFEVVVQ